jgi:hypothetical protein
MAEPRDQDLDRDLDRDVTPGPKDEHVAGRAAEEPEDELEETEEEETEEEDAGQ